MPTYEYACRQCGHHLEVVQSFKDDPLKDCPNCAGELRKVFSPIGIAFKGSGFYRNDSRSSGAKTSESKTSESKTSETKSSDSKSASGMAPQFTVTSGFPVLGLESCSAATISSLPVPLSPVTSTVHAELATR